MTGTHRILIGDCRETLAQVATGSVQCIVTSPPYWGLRSYKGGSGMIGLEPTFAEHLANLMQVFGECWRVLRDDGVMWVNYGDAYSGGGRGGNPDDSPFRKQATNAGSLVAPIECGMSDKNLLGMPWRVAFALQEAGWTLRADVIWAKPNPMPESVTDRPTKSHEYVFLLSKRARYFYDAEAIKEAGVSPEVTADEYAKTLRDTSEQWHQRASDPYNGTKKSDNNLLAGKCPPGGRNRRSVWTIPTAPFADAHFATFPPALVEPCVKAGTSERGQCPACGAPWERVVEKSGGTTGQDWNTREKPDGLASDKLGGHAEWSDYKCRTTGWRPTCGCNAGEPVPQLVGDPFGGSGTVAAVACPLGRNAVVCEISPEYAAMAEDRIGRACRPNTHASKRAVDAPLFTGATP